MKYKCAPLLLVPVLTGLCHPTTAVRVRPLSCDGFVSLAEPKNT